MFETICCSVLLVNALVMTLFVITFSDRKQGKFINKIRNALFIEDEAFEDYGDGDFWAGVGEAGLVGGLTSMAYGGTVGKVMKTSGVYADANAVMDDVDGLERKLRTKWLASGTTAAMHSSSPPEAANEVFTMLPTFCLRLMI